MIKSEGDRIIPAPTRRETSLIAKSRSAGVNVAAADGRTGETFS